MNIYVDYRNYIDECDELIEMLKEKGASVYYAISDVLKVTEYIYNEYYLWHLIVPERSRLWILSFLCCKAHGDTSCWSGSRMCWMWLSCPLQSTSC